MAWLRSLGHDVSDDWVEALRTEPTRPAEHSASRFQTDRIVEWLEANDGPWLLHASYLRPHPPYAAAGHFSTMYSPEDVPDPIAPGRRGRADLVAHPRHATPRLGAPQDPARMRRVLGQYYGMVSEADEQVGLLRAALERLGLWADTVVVVTADHGEQPATTD